MSGRFLSAHAAMIEAEEPQLIAFHVYFNEAGDTASVVQVHPDSATERHMHVISEHMGPAFEIIDTIQTEQYYGPMSESLAETLAQFETPGTAVAKMPDYEAGFTRATAAVSG